MTTRLLSRALVIGILGIAPVFAQTTPPAASTVTRAHAMVERRISELHSQLKITPSQQSVFDAFANVMRDNAGRMTGLLQDRRKTLGSMNAVEQMKGYQEVAQAHAEDMQRLVPAFEHLYEALTPEQKKLADTSFRDFANSAGRNKT